MSDSDDRLAELSHLKEQRKNGEIGIIEYYKGLLKTSASLLQNLWDEDITEEEAKKQIPLLLICLEGQIEKLASRGK